MHQTAKGQQWYFGMKAHVGVDSKTKLIHTVLASAANVQDRDALPYLLHGAETRVWGDQGYQGHTHLIHRHAPRAKDFTNKRYRFRGRVNEVEKAKNRNKSRVRAKVEHVFGVIKKCTWFAADCSMHRGRVAADRTMRCFEATTLGPRARFGRPCDIRSKSLAQLVLMFSNSELP
jgi:IS5 family transposase